MALQRNPLDFFKVFKIFRSVSQRRLSGLLRLWRGDASKVIWFRAGVPIAASSSLPEEALMTVLVTEGLLSSEERLTIEQNTKSESEQARRAVECGLIAVPRLQMIQARVERQRMLSALSWMDGEFVFEPQELRSDLKREGVELTALLLEAVARFLSDYECAQFVASFSAQCFELPACSPQMGAFYDTLFPAPNARTFALRPVTLPQLETKLGKRATREACAILVSGLGHFAQPGAQQAATPQAQPRPQPLQPAPAARPAIPTPPSARPMQPASRVASPSCASRVASPSSAVFIPSAPPPAPSPSSATPASASPAPASSSTATPPKRAATAAASSLLAKPPTADILARVEKARAIVASQDSKNYYELLGVEQSADQNQIRDAFRKLAREFHADRFARFDLDQDARMAVQKAFIAFNRAHEVLSVPESRKEYDLGLKSGFKTGAPADAATGFDAILEAEKAVSNGLRLTHNNQMAPALELFQKALAVTPDDPLAQAGAAYCEFMIACEQGRAADVAKRTKEALQKVTSTFKRREEPFLFLGRVLRVENEWEAASEAFKQAVKVAPHSTEAALELRHITRKLEENASKGQQKSKGLFGFMKKG